MRKGDVLLKGKGEDIVESTIADESGIGSSLQKLVSSGVIAGGESYHACREEFSQGGANNKINCGRQGPADLKQIKGGKSKAHVLKRRWGSEWKPVAHLHEINKRDAFTHKRGGKKQRQSRFNNKKQGAVQNTGRSLKKTRKVPR